MARFQSGSARSGTMVNGHALFRSRMNDSFARTLLTAGGLVIFALAVGLFSSPEWRWVLISVGLLGLLAYHAWRSNLPHGRAPRHAGGTGTVERREDAARSSARALPEGLALSYGVAILDRDYCIVWCNDTAAAHFGIDVQHDIGRPIATLVRHPSFVEYVAAGNFSKSLRMQTTEGNGPILSVQFVPYVASGWLLLSRNVVRAARLETVRRECIANVSHELRTPLTVLVGFLETVRELKLDPRLSRDYLDLMEEQCKRMQRIITDLLQLSTLESASDPPGDKRVNVSGMLARIHAEGELLSAGRHRIVLETEDGLDLLGAESEIASAFGNLASNAVRYTPPGGAVRFLWRASPKGAEFTVEDTGIGIGKEHIPRLTERFYRVDRDRSRYPGGTGLGLAIVKHVLLRHQATLEIESEAGKGSRFTARFPAHRVIRTTT